MGWGKARKIIRIAQGLDRELNQKHLEYEAGVLTINPRHILKYYEHYSYLYKYRRRWVNNIKMELREGDRMVRTGSIWLRIGTSGGLL
jgi:hypothetical protein